MTYVLLAATITSGLLAGLFYAFAISVMPALRDADDTVFTDAMQRINKVITNGWFALSFGGTPLLGAVAAVLAWRGGPDGVLLPVLAGLAFYVVQFLITGAVNVPLNNGLARATAPGPARRAFETRWVRANVLRTWASVASFASFGWGLTQL